MLPSYDVIKADLFVARNSQVLSAYLSQRVYVLSLYVEQLPDPILRVINAHVSVDDDLMLHVLALHGEADRGLLRDLMIPEGVLVIVGELNEKT